jgi:GNAT superfamily N-acetyltransferase
MNVELSKEPLTFLTELARIPIAFKVDRVFDVIVHEGGLGGFTLLERRVDVPYVKDYDAILGEGPTHWASSFDMTNWGLITSRTGGLCVGGAVVALKTAGISMLEGRSDLAVVWDIRVSPERRKQGVGSSLFQAAEAWAAAKGCRQLKVETQNINVGACKFYARQGCVLGAINRFAYPELPNEVQLLWYKNLSVAPLSVRTG